MDNNLYAQAKPSTEPQSSEVIYKLNYNQIQSIEDFIKEYPYVDRGQVAKHLGLVKEYVQNYLNSRPVKVLGQQQHPNSEIKTTEI